MLNHSYYLLLKYLFKYLSSIIQSHTNIFHSYIYFSIKYDCLFLLLLLFKLQSKSCKKKRKTNLFNKKREKEKKNVDFLGC